MTSQQEPQNPDEHTTGPDEPNTDLETAGRPDIEQTQTVPRKPSPADPDTPDDVETDPALDDRLGSDWTDEGGATAAGPATSIPGGIETEESKRQIRVDRERADHVRHPENGDGGERGAQ